MFVRIVTSPLKPGHTSEYAKAIEHRIIPLLRQHKGFLDEIALVSEGGKTALGISFWDTKENAEAYSRSGYAGVMKALEKATTGPGELKTYHLTNSTAHHIAATRVA